MFVDVSAEILVDRIVIVILFVQDIDIVVHV